MPDELIQEALDYNYFAGITRTDDRQDATDEKIKAWANMTPKTATERWISQLGNKYLKETDRGSSNKIKDLINKLYNNEMVNVSDLKILAMQQ